MEGLPTIETKRTIVSELIDQIAGKIASARGDERRALGEFQTATIGTGHQEANAIGDSDPCGVREVALTNITTHTRRAETNGNLLRTLRDLDIKNPHDTIKAGSLVSVRPKAVELSSDSPQPEIDPVKDAKFTAHYFLIPGGSNTTVTHDGIEVTCINPELPIGKTLINGEDPEQDEAGNQAGFVFKNPLDGTTSEVIGVV